MPYRHAGIALCAALSLGACNSSAPPSTGAPTGPDTALIAPRPTTESVEPDGVRSTPNPLCAADYLGTTGQLQSLSDPGLGIPTATEGGAAAPAHIAATLPDVVHLRDTRQSHNATHYYALREGRIYLKANRELTGIEEPWRALLLPSCLDGKVSQLSVDGTVILALDDARWIYTLDTANYGPGTTGWTRRWGAFFWTDPGEQVPEDVQDWATSHLAGSDTTYIDSAGREQDVFGILTLYALRGDGLRITYMDPWLPSDESREVCGPERGTVAMAGMSGSGSTVMVVSRSGEIYTRLYEFDVSGANSVFFDYSWQDQEDVAAPLFQLPAPDWIHHPRVPGRITSKVSLRKVSPDTVHRIMRVEGLNDQGHRGYWEKDLPDSRWHFVRTDEAIQGSLLPLPGPWQYEPEDLAYAGTIDGYPAEVLSFNPYCSPTTLRLHINPGAPTDLVLHSTDGLRQERRARGLNAQPHVYRSAIEVPKALWQQRGQQTPAVQAFLTQHFGEQRFLTGPLSATPATLQVSAPCWTLRRSSPTADALLPSIPPDLGVYVAELAAAQEEGRPPSACAPAF
jgi:phage-related protein